MSFCERMRILSQKIRAKLQKNFHISKKNRTFAAKMKKIITFISLLACIEAYALDVEYRLSLRGGVIMPDGKVDVMMGQKGHWIPAAGGELAVTFAPDLQSLREWNGARVGVALSYWKLNCERTGTSDIMGHAIAPYAFAEIPLIKRTHFEWGLRPGIGCSFITKTYYNTVLPEQIYTHLNYPNVNRSVGSVFNYYFPEAMYFYFPIKSGWTVGLTAGWYHMSNGSIQQPNSGYNIFSGELAVKYQPSIVSDQSSESKPTKEYSLDKLRAKHCEIEFAWSGAARQVYYRDQQTFFCSELQIAAYWRAHRIFRLGGGVDAFYDGAYIDRPTSFGKTDLTGATQKDCWRVGVSVQPEFVMGHLTAGFHFGVYLYDPIQKREGDKKEKGIFYAYDLLNAGSAGYPDGWLYTQIALRYRLPYHLFVHGVMKAHLTKVEFVAFGIGAYL